MDPLELDSNIKKSNASKLDEIEDFVTGAMSSPLPRGYFFRSLYSISYSEYQPFLAKLRSKARLIG